MNRVGVVAALAREARALAPPGPPDDARDPRVVPLEDNALLTESGMGWDAAEAAARRLAEAGATALVSFGTAGALDPALAHLAVVVPEAVVTWEGTVFGTHRPWRESLLAACPRDVPVAAGRLLSCREAVGSRLDKAIAWRESGCAAVDMESAAIARYAADAAIPFLAVRVIVDSAADELPQAVLAASRAGEVSVPALLAALACAPWTIAAVARLARRFRHACAVLDRIGEPGMPARRALTDAGWGQGR